jgi:general stress protein 26
MSAVEPTTELHSAFSEPGAQAPPWADVLDVLTNSEMFWLSSVRRDGRPHVTPLPTIWLDGALHFCTGDAEQKAKNLASNPNCILTTGTNQLHAGLDVVVEGAAARVTDKAQLQRLAALWKSELDWNFEVGDGEFHHPDAPASHVLVFAVAPTKVLAFGKDPYSQTRYRFAA